MAEVRSRALSDRTDPLWVLGLITLFVMALGLSSCNTIEGMGKDVSAAGGAVSDTAKDTKEEM